MKTACWAAQHSTLMPALMELVDHMGPLRLMQPSEPMESVDSSNLQQTLDQSTLDFGAGVSCQPCKPSKWKAEF